MRWGFAPITEHRGDEVQIGQHPVPVTEPVPRERTPVQAVDRHAGEAGGGDGKTPVGTREGLLVAPQMEVGPPSHRVCVAHLPDVVDLVAEFEPAVHSFECPVVASERDVVGS